MKEELATRYNPADFEKRIYDFWESGGFFTPVVDDPYVFAVPSAINFGGLKSLDDAPPDVARVLNNCIQFHFGTQYTLRVQQWYQRHRDDPTANQPSR